MDEPKILREAEDFLSSLTRADLIYSDSVTIGRSLDYDEYVTVATFGAADDLACPNDEPEPWPIRVGVQNADRDTAEAYLSIAEAKELARALMDAIRRAKGFPQPGDTLHSGDRATE